VPIPQQRDLEATRKTLEAWLAPHLLSTGAVTITELRTPEGTGYSNETFTFDARWTTAGGEQSASLVARIRPSAYSVFMNTDVAQQYRVMKLLGEHSDVPVPKVLWLEEDESVLGSPFFVMEKVEGRIPTDVPSYNAAGFVFDMPPEKRRLLWESAIDALVRIHKVDWREAGFGFLDHAEDGPTGIPQFLRYLRRYFEWAAGDRPQPVADAAWTWIEQHEPPAPPAGLCWGDARVSNMIFDDTRCAAVLDWEMVLLAPSERDLGWWLFLDRFHSEGMGVARLPGLPGREETIEVYEALLGRPVDQLEFYEVLAGFYFAVIMIRIAQMLITYGDLPPDSDFERDNPVTQLLARMLDVDTGAGAKL